MKLSLDALQLLDEIQRRGSFAAAAQALDKAPSSRTYVVQKLEQDLDVLLYDRSGQRARLTLAVDATLPWDPFMDWVSELDLEAQGTRLKFTRGVLPGMWDALVSGGRI